MLQKINTAVTHGEVWVSAGEKIVQYFPYVLGFISLTGLGAYFAQGWHALSNQGWGVYPLVGAAFALVVSASVFMLSRTRYRERATKTASTSVPSAVVKSEVFQNCTVILDGKTFQSCRFENCTYRWNGGPFSIHHCECIGTRRFESQNPTAVQTIDLLKALNLLGGAEGAAFAKSWSRLSEDYFSAGR